MKIIQVFISALILAACVIFFASTVRSETIVDAGANITNKTATDNQKRYSTSLSYSKDQSFLSLGYDYTSYGADTVGNEISGSIGYDNWISDKWESWSFASGSHDRAINKQNYDAGGGVKYVFTDGKQYFSLSGGLIVTHMDYLDTKTNEIRFSFRPKLKLRYGDFEFNSIFFYQPEINNASDYILKGFCEGKYNLTKRTGIKLRFEDEYISKFDYNKAKTMLMISVKWGCK